MQIETDKVGVHENEITIKIANVEQVFIVKSKCHQNDLSDGDFLFLE